MKKRDEHYMLTEKGLKPGYTAIRAVPNLSGRYINIITGGGKATGELFPWVHVVIGNLKRFLLGTHHHVGKNHLDGYIAEYVYRLNRRFHEEDLFEHLLMACLFVSPKPKKHLQKQENSL